MPTTNGSEQIRRLAETLGGEPGVPELAALWQQVLLKRAWLEEAVALLWCEVGVCVCDADGCMTAPERQFLARLAALLQLDSNVTAPLDR